MNEGRGWEEGEEGGFAWEIPTARQRSTDIVGRV